jgi:hypothetical protein
MGRKIREGPARIGKVTIASAICFPLEADKICHKLHKAVNQKNKAFGCSHVRLQTNKKPHSREQGL